MTHSAISRRSALKSALVGGTFLALPACVREPIASAARTDSPDALLESAAWRLLRLKPEGATVLGIDTGEHSDLRYHLEDRSPAGVAATETLLKADLARVEAIDASAADPTTRTSLEVVKSAYGVALAGFAQPYGDVAVGGWRNTPYVVIQNVGAYLDTPRFLDSDHPVRDAADAEAYLSRLSEMPGQLDGELARVRSAAEYGLVPPDFLLDRTIAQMEAAIADARGGGALVESLVDRTANIPGDWGPRAGRIAIGEVAPAMGRQLAELRRLRSRATSAPGMGERPGGDEFYRWALRAATTTTLSPDQIHELGLEELEALHARMDPILASLGYTGGSVGERMTAIGQDPQFMFPAGDPGRQEILDFIRDRIDWIKAQMPRAFRRLATGNVEVRRLPLAEEPGAPTAYGGAGSIDGSIPGKMWINLRTTDLHRKYDLPTLVHHESIPGHVWQGEYSNQLPLIRSILSFSAYTEGWALYGEQLADELGAYDDDPVGRLGYLQALSFRACRMVVDTGLHAKGWPRERAIRFFMERNGNKREEVVNEVDRYCSWPGQACGYKMGHSEILRQRARARAALGEAYDLRDFDQAVVDGGNVPLDVLEKNVERYIGSASG